MVLLLLLLLLFFLALAWTGLVTTLSLWKVDLHVLGNITLCLETLATNITFEIPEASVSKHVLIEITNSVESFPTLITFMILDITVCQGVCGEVRLQNKYFFHTVDIHNS